jgi:uncharacterized protein
MWRLDSEYRALRREVPWLTRRPSEYIREHVRVTTQPIDEPERPEDLVELLNLVHAEDLLCYSSDYPHWDQEGVDHLAKVLPPEWHDRVFRENALALYSWSDAAVSVTNTRAGA